MNLTPLNSWHHSHGGRMVDFAGWQMPVQYTSIVDEHNAVRQNAGLFDISHMGRLKFTGAAAGDFLNNVLTNDTSRLKVGEIRYSLICRQDGGMLDDVLVYRMEDHWLLVVNASNRKKIVDWLERHPDFPSSQMNDLTLQTGMIAVQGPQALPRINQLVGADLSAMKYYSGRILTYAGISGLVSRTGYTGEDGFELIVPATECERIWKLLISAAQASPIVPAGLGCRDTLRLEAAMPLYGHELTESIDPLTAGLGFAVRMSKVDFIGKAALSSIQAAGLKKTRVGLAVEGRRIAREDTPLLKDGQVIGRITSGTFSPTLQKVIAMAYVLPELAAEGTTLTVDLRGTAVPAIVVRLPFYQAVR